MPEGRKLIVFDVGNTTVKCAVGRRGAWEILCRVATCPTEGLEDRLNRALPTHRLKGLEAARVLACSVHPPADRPLRTFCARRTGRGPEFFGTDLPAPIENVTEAPEKVGADRLLLALGARELCGAPCVVISAGTAITVDLVDAEGRFAGGAIAAGFGLCARALGEGAELLPLVQVETPPPPGPAKNTREAIRRGVFWSCAGGAGALVEQYRRALDAPQAPVVCTGSDAPLLMKGLEADDIHHEPYLIFEGMAAAL